MKRYIATFLFLILTILFFAGLFASGARAVTLSYDKHIKSFGNWRVGFSSSHSGCVTQITYTDKTTLWVGWRTFIDDDDDVEFQMYVGITNPGWSVNSDEIDLQLHMDKRQWSTSSSSVVAPDEGVVFIIHNQELANDFKSARSLIVTENKKRVAALSLRGSRVAISEAWDCQKAWVELSIEKHEASKVAKHTPEPSPEPEPSDKSNSNGTGFYVSKEGHVLTNHHVTQSCKAIRVITPSGNTVAAKVIQSDEQLDLSLLQTELKITEPVEFATAIDLGESSYAFGYPLQGLLSGDGNFTSGIVTGTSGLNGDFKHVQTSTPVQPGNSGGALFNEYGKVIGVVTYKLNALAVAKATNDIPQNVNFAVKSSLARAFVEMAGIHTTSNRMHEKLSSANIAKHAQRVSVKVECH